MYKDLAEALNEHAERKLPYFQQWMFDSPILVSHEKFQETNTLHSVFYKLVNYFVSNYQCYHHLMPLDDRVLKILSLWESKAYEVGSFRTDFVFDENEQFRPIEITCRFALNGFFVNKVFELHANATKDNVDAFDLHNPYEQFIPHFLNKLRDKQKILLLKDSEDRNESKFFLPVFAQAGISIEVRTVFELNQNHSDLDEFLIINEFNFEELMQLRMSTHESLALSDCLNDLRTVFLIHDKRFFSVICNQDIIFNALDSEERAFFETVVIPTFSFEKHHQAWISAKTDKDNWVLKHRALGKSEAVYAGTVTPQKVWEQLFERNDIHDFVLQKWIKQKRISGHINDEIFNDFITGTLLFFDEFNFGFADFRTSSFPVTNKVDHRKCIALILKEGAEQKYAISNKGIFNE